LRGQDNDLAKTLQTRQKYQEWVSSILDGLPSRLNVTQAHSGLKLEDHWHSAASPAPLVQENFDSKSLEEEMKENLPIDPSLPLTQANASGDSAHAGVAGAAPTRASDLPAFRDISEAEYEQAAREYSNAHNNGEPPPLNPEQRLAARSILRICEIRAAHLRAGTSSAAYKDDLEREGLTNVVLLCGPGGAGKSAVVHQLASALAELGLGQVVITAFTGVAAAPFGGATLLKLFSLSMFSKTQEHMSVLSAVKVVAGKQRFLDESGKDIKNVALVVIDEHSFNPCTVFGHVDHRMGAMTGDELNLFGGMPLLLCGDNHQKPPPGGKPWYKLMVDFSLEKSLQAWDKVQANVMTATQRGLRLLECSRLVTLKRIMRAAGDKPFADLQHSLRQTDKEATISPSFIKSLKTVSASDAQNDPSWLFAPIATLAHIERDSLNVRQMRAFANFFGKPIIKWRLRITEKGLPDGLNYDRLYEEEDVLWCYVVVGMPVMLTQTIKATRKLTNGTPGLIHSLSFEGACPQEYTRGLQQGLDEIVLQQPPSAVNVRVGQSQSEASFVPPGVTREFAKRRGVLGKHVWHGVPLDDLSELIRTCVPGEQVMCIRKSPDVEEMTLVGTYSAMMQLGRKIDCQVMQFQPAFAVTDFKLQGRTLPKLILNICHRPVAPYMTWCSFYVMVSRVTERDGLRLLIHDKAGLAKLNKLRMPSELVAWERGYKILDSGLGVWDRTLAASALATFELSRAKGQASKAPRKGGKENEGKPPPPAKRQTMPHPNPGAAKRTYTAAGSGTRMASKRKDMPVVETGDLKRSNACSSEE
jgi:Mrp family chromosome partitioning ATPase